MNVSGRSVRALLALAALASPTAATAQISTVGSPFATATGGSAYARTADVGHDSTHNVYLHATTEHQTGRVFGSFSNGDGGLISAGFRIDSTANFPFGPAIAYSPQADVFLVIWVNDAAQVRGRLVRYGTGALGSADFLLGSGARKTWAPAIAYSATSQEFLVSWSSSAGPNWILRVGTSGGAIGSPVMTTGNVWTQEPALAWNPTNNEFMLAYAQEINPGWQVRVQRISQGQLVGGPVSIHAAGSTKMPDIAYSTLSGKFLVCWFQGSPYGIYSRLMNANATAAAAVQPLLPSNYGSYDANSLAYNDYSDTFAVASITPQNSQDTIGGAQVSSLGVPGTAALWVQAPAGSGNRRYPEIAGSAVNGRFVTIFNKSQSSFYGQALSTSTTGGGGGGEPPPPPPPPPPATLTVSLASNKTFPITLGTAVTFTAAASGGTTPYTYRFVTYNAAVGWAITQDYSALNTFTYYPGAGSNAVQVWVRNAGSTKDYDAYAGTGYFTVNTSTPVVTSLTSNKVFPQPLGTLVTFTATASGGVNPQYRFVTYNAAAGWAITQDYSSLNTFSYYPGAGTNAVQVWVRNLGSTADYQSWKGTGYFTISSTTASIPTSVSLTAQQAFPAAYGTPISFTAQAVGGTNVRYRFVTYNQSTGWAITQDYSQYNTFTYYPGAGTNAVQVWVRNEGSTADYQAWAGTGYFTIQ